MSQTVVATASMQHSSARPLSAATASVFITRRVEWADPINNSGTPREWDAPGNTSNAHTIAVACTRIYARYWDQIRAREQNPFTRRERRGPRYCLFTPPVWQSPPVKPRTHVEPHREPQRFLGFKHWLSSSARGEEEWRIRAPLRTRAKAAMLLLLLGRLVPLMERPQPESSPGASPWGAKCLTWAPATPTCLISERAHTEWFGELWLSYLLGHQDLNREC